MNSTANAIQHLDRVLPTSTFTLGEYISEGLSLWKKEAGPFIGFGLIYIIISGMAGVIPFLGTIANQIIITPALSAGAFIFAHSIHKAERKPDFGQFFDGFKYASEIVIAQLIYAFCMIVLLIPFFISVFSGFFDMLDTDSLTIATEFADSFSPWKMLLLFPALVAAFCFSYSIHFIVFYKLKAMDAIKYSFKFVSKHALPFIGLMLISMLFLLGGVLCFIIGVFFIFTIIYTLSYASFKGVTRLEEFEGGDESGKVHDALIF